MATMKPGINEAIIEGVLYEKIVREFEDGAIAGELVFEVPTTVDGDEVNSLIPVSFYSKPETKAGKPNPAYKGIKTILDNAKSLSEVGGEVDKADKIRLRNGTIGENMFISQDDKLVSFARIRGNFFDRVKESDYQPKAQFKVKMVISNIEDEQAKIDGELVDTGRLAVTGHIVQFNGTIDEVKFIVSTKKNIDFVNKGWKINDTVNAQGTIGYFTKEVAVVEDSGDSFGEPMTTTQTRRIREHIITSGSVGPVDGYEEEDVLEARKERKSRIAALKEKSSSAKEEAPKSKSKARDW